MATSGMGTLRSAPGSFRVVAGRSELRDSSGWLVRSTGCFGAVSSAPEVAFELGLVHEVVDDAVTRALELANEIALLPPMAVANAKRALYQGADTHLQAAFEIEDMNWTEVMQSDDAQLAMTTILGLNPENARDWFESENSKNYPTYTGH